MGKPRWSAQLVSTSSRWTVNRRKGYAADSMVARIRLVGFSLTPREIGRSLVEHA